MEKTTNVAQFIAQRIRATGKSQRDIAIEAGFASPNMVTMLKQGKTKLPLGKVGQVAKALETDPVRLLKMALSEYHPDLWQATRNYFDEALTEDELKMVQAFRRHVGVPYVSALNDDQQDKLKAFLGTLTGADHRPVSIH